MGKFVSAPKYREVPWLFSLLLWRVLTQTFLFLFRCFLEFQNSPIHHHFCHSFFVRFSNAFRLFFLLCYLVTFLHFTGSLFEKSVYPVTRTTTKNKFQKQNFLKAFLSIGIGGVFVRVFTRIANCSQMAGEQIWTSTRGKNIFEQLSRPRFFPGLEISRPFSHLFSTEKRAGKFKSQKKSWSWKLF